MCEAKAYAEPLNEPTWHKILGKLHLARAENNTTVGILVALSGVNGNVAGSHAQLSKVDSAVFIIEGREVEESALVRGELLPALTVRDVLEAKTIQMDDPLRQRLSGLTLTTR